jgi:hypothetical protein
MKKLSRVLAAVVAVGFAAGLAAAPVGSASASPQVRVHASDTGWG